MCLCFLMICFVVFIVLIVVVIGVQVVFFIFGCELLVGVSDVQQYFDGSFLCIQDVFGGLIFLIMSYFQLSFLVGECLNLGMDVVLVIVGGNLVRLGMVKFSSGLCYDVQIQGFYLQQFSVDDFILVNQGGCFDLCICGLFNVWLSDYVQCELIYKLDLVVVGVFGVLQVQVVQVKNGKLVVIFNQNLGNLVLVGLLGK